MMLTWSGDSGAPRRSRVHVVRHSQSEKVGASPPDQVDSVVPIGSVLARSVKLCPATMCLTQMVAKNRVGTAPALASPNKTVQTAQTMWTCQLQDGFEKQSGVPLTTKDHKENGTKSLEFMMIKFGERGHPDFRATSPLSRGTLKSKGGGDFSVHFCADGDTIATLFRTIISVNQLSIHGAGSRFGMQYLSNKNGETRIGHCSLQQTY